MCPTGLIQGELREIIRKVCPNENFGQIIPRTIRVFGLAHGEGIRDIASNIHETTRTSRIIAAPTSMNPLLMNLNMAPKNLVIIEHPRAIEA